MTPLARFAVAVILAAVAGCPAAPPEVEYIRGQLIGEPIRIEAVRRVSR